MIALNIMKAIFFQVNLTDSKGLAKVRVTPPAGLGRGS